MLLVKQGYYKEFDHFELLDVVYAYFMNVQHLKDWVKNYDSVLEGDINKLYQVECFKICADFINNHKHLVRNGSGKKAATDPDASIKQQSVTVEVC